MNIEDKESPGLSLLWTTFPLDEASPAKLIRTLLYINLNKDELKETTVHD